MTKTQCHMLQTVFGYKDGEFVFSPRKYDVEDTHPQLTSAQELIDLGLVEKFDNGLKLKSFPFSIRKV